MTADKSEVEPDFNDYMEATKAISLDDDMIIILEPKEIWEFMSMIEDRNLSIID